MAFPPQKKNNRSKRELNPQTQKHTCVVVFTVALLSGAVDLAVVDVVDDVVRGTAVNGAAHRLCSAQDLLDGSRQLTGHGSVAHGAGDVNHGVHGDVAGVHNYASRQKG